MKLNNNFWKKLLMNREYKCMCINKTESMLDRMKVSWQFNMSIDV